MGRNSRGVITVRGKTMKNASHTHVAYLRTRIDAWKSSPRFAQRNSARIETKSSPESIVTSFGGTVFACCIHDVFPVSYVRKFQCACGSPAQERCHAPEESRLQLLLRATERLWSTSASSSVTLADLKLAFLEEHLTTNFLLKCRKCHRHETTLTFSKSKKRPYSAGGEEVEEEQQQPSPSPPGKTEQVAGQDSEPAAMASEETLTVGFTACMAR